MGAFCSCQSKEPEQLPPTPLPPKPTTPECPSIVFHDSCSHNNDPDHDHCHPCHQDHNSGCELVTTTMPAITSAPNTTQFCLSLVTPTSTHPSVLSL